MKLFIVEDSELVRERLIRLINRNDNVKIVGYSDNIVESIEMMKKLKPDFIILDIILDGKNSLDFLDKIYEALPQAEIVVYTNYPYSLIKKYSSNKGIKHFFDKSKDLESLLELIKNTAMKYSEKTLW